MIFDAASRARFLRECRAVAALNHPNIATLYEADETGDGTLYFAAELVRGRTLAEHLRGGPLPLDRAVDIGVQLSRALAAAHERGIVHRDIKPANVMIGPDGGVKVLDFGLAHIGIQFEPFDAEAPTKTIGPNDAAHSQTLGAVVGTPGYMAPEQIRGEPVGPAADVFAAGVVLYEMTTGVRLFPGPDLEARLAQVLDHDPLAPADVNRRVSRPVSAVIARCLDKDPRRRFADGAALLEALTRASRRPPTRRTWAAAAAATAAVAAAGIWWSTRDTLGFASQDRLLIAAVDNQTAEQVFGGALGTALEVDLRQSQYAIVVGRNEIVEALQLTRRPPDTPLDLETALDLARWVGAEAVLSPSIVEIAGTYRLQATLYATGTASPVDTVTVVAGGKDEVLRDAVDELTAGVRQRLGESLAQIEAADAPVVKVTTASWDALETLRLGLNAVDEQKMPQAAGFFEEALRRDAEFAAARAQLGLVLIQYLNQPARGRQLLAEAAASADRLTAYERVMLQALATQFVDGNLESALEQFRTAAGLFPARMEPYQNQGIILRAQGKFDEAAGAFREAIARAPKTATPYGLLWFLQVGPVRDPAGAEVTSRAVLNLRPDDPGFSHMLGWSYVGQLRFDDAAKQLEAIVADHPGYTRARINLAHLALRRGDVAGAADRYRSILDDARAGRIEQEIGPTALWLAIALRAAGRDEEAAPHFDAADAAAKTPVRRALVDAARGRVAEARRTLDTLPPVDKLDYGSAHTAASAFAFAGDADRALALVSHALGLNPWDVYYNLILPEMRPLWTDERFTKILVENQR